MELGSRSFWGGVITKIFSKIHLDVTTTTLAYYFEVYNKDFCAGRCRVAGSVDVASAWPGFGDPYFADGESAWCRFRVLDSADSRSAGRRCRVLDCADGESAGHRSRVADSAHGEWRWLHAAVIGPGVVVLAADAGALVVSCPWLKWPKNN